MDNPTLEQLRQLLTVTWDGNLISKSRRDTLVKAEMARKVDGGWNMLTAKGVQIAEVFGLIKPN